MTIEAGASMKEKVVLVTGARGGLGTHVMPAFLEAGASRRYRSVTDGQTQRLATPYRTRT